MKTAQKLSIFLAFAFFTLVGFATQAQDIITMRNGEQIKASNIEVDGTVLKYKKFELPEGATYSKYLKDVSKITYENGDVEEFSSSNGNGANYSISGRNLVGYNYFDLSTLNFSFIYERILTEDKAVSLYIPIRMDWLCAKLKLSGKAQQLRSRTGNFRLSFRTRKDFLLHRANVYV
jgi:hypothetical protein